MTVLDGFYAYRGTRKSQEGDLAFQFVPGQSDSIKDILELWQGISRGCQLLQIILVLEGIWKNWSLKKKAIFITRTNDIAIGVTVHLQFLPSSRQSFQGLGEQPECPKR